jgi:hypothetical protein
MLRLKNCDLVMSFSPHHLSMIRNNLVGNRKAVDVISAWIGVVDW